MVSKTVTAIATALALAGCGRKAQAAPDLPRVTTPVPGAVEPVIGINLALYGNTYFGQEYPFIDRFKTADKWMAQDSAYREVKAPVPLDADGWPTALPPSAIRITIPVGVDQPGSGTTRRYVVTWRGKGDVGLELTKPLSQGDHRITFAYDGEGTGPLITIARTDPADHVRDIHVVREDQQALLAQGEIFNPAFLEKIAPWRVLRFMDWQQTNGSPIHHWSERSKMTDAVWGGRVPLDVIIALAKRTGADIWLNVPAEADDDYVRGLLTLVRDTLPPRQRLFLEYSNEVWNWGFGQSDYARRQAERTFGKNGDWMTWSGYRSAQIAALTDQVFGAASKARVVNVLGTQAALPGLTYSLEDGVKKANVGSVNQLFERYAIATYFGGALSGNTPADIQRVLGWAGQGQAGIDAAMRELEHGGTTEDKSDALTQSIGVTMPTQAAVAKQLGLPLTTYEAGVHVTAFGYPQDKQAEVVAFFRKLTADPRMGDYYRRLAHGVGAAGGREFMVFSDSTAPSQFGLWGILDSTYQATSPRYDAMKAAAAKAGGRIGGGEGSASR